MRRNQVKITPFFRYLVLFSGLIIFWSAISAITKLPKFILPDPVLVADRFWKALIDGQLVYHTMITLFEVVSGLLLGTIAAVLLGYIIFKSPALEHFFSPLLVASQAIPVVAVAPMLVIWFGPGLFSKILVCSLIIFFPVLVNTLAGLKNIPAELLDLLTTSNANTIQILQKLEIPATLPLFFTGMRIGATLSVTGAVVGEFLGADKGLGFLINIARGQYDTALVVVVIFVLVFLALSLYHLVQFIEYGLLKWKE